MASLDPNCELADLESQVSSAKEAQNALSTISWADVTKHKTAVQSLVNHSLMRVNYQ